MSEQARAPVQARQAAPVEKKVESKSTERSEGKRPEQVTSPGTLFDIASIGVADPRTGFDLSRVPVHSQTITQNYVGESVAPGTASRPIFIVDNSVRDLEPGQMRKNDFLDRLRSAVTCSAEEALAGTGRTTRDCPYLRYWFGYYSHRESEQIERAVHRYANETVNAVSAEDYIPIIANRVRRSVEIWADSGEITGMPEGLSLGVADWDLTGNVGGLLSRISGIFFKARNGGVRSVSTESPQAVQVKLGQGRPLESRVRSRMESVFGTDFTHVRTHTDVTASELAGRFNARAFTVGSHVAFSAGEYRPGTPVGDALIAHELAHVRQQDIAEPAVKPMQLSDFATDSSETDADAAAVSVLGALWLPGTRIKNGLSMNSSPRSKIGLRLQRCSSKRTLSPVPDTPETRAVKTAVCGKVPEWKQGDHVTPTFVLDKPAPKRSNSDSSTVETDEPTFTGEITVDCKKMHWHYQIKSVESKGKMQIVYYTAAHYPAPTPTDDSGPLTNVTSANWEEILQDFKDNRTGIPDFWSAHQAEDLHEGYHWEKEWKVELKKGVNNAEKEMEVVGVGFDEAKTKAEAQELVEPEATEVFNDAMEKVSTAYSDLGDEPGDPPYIAQAPAIDALGNRVKAHAKTEGWTP